MLKSVFLIVPLLALSVSTTVYAQVHAQSIPHPSSLHGSGREHQRFSRDLIPTRSQDFFSQGRNQLEQEIRRLEPRSRTQSDSPLQIDPALRSPSRKQSLREISGPASNPLTTSTDADPPR